MEKIPLQIAALSYSQTQNGAYALILSEEKGNRRLPIVIGSNEAQAIAVELEKMTPSRPLTHDLFKAFAESFKIDLIEVIIYNLVEGIFFAKLVCKRGEEILEIDARTSDAIALAVRFNSPIFTYEFILSTAGITSEDEEGEDEDETVPSTTKKGEEVPVQKSEFGTSSIKELEELLTEALRIEDYERASRIRDEIKRLKNG